MDGIRAFKRYFEVSGRANRAEYWQFVFIVILINLLAKLVDFQSAANTGRISILSAIVSIVTLIPGITAAIRRLHDRDKSGWILFGYPILAVIFAGVAFYSETPNGSDFAEGGYLRPLLFMLLAACIIYFIYIIVLLVLPGDDYENRYGPPFHGDISAPVRDGFNRSPISGSHSLNGQEDSSSSGRDVPPRSLDAYEDIQRLGELRDKGYLTDEEFSAKKALLLK